MFQQGLNTSNACQTLATVQEDRNNSDEPQEICGGALLKSHDYHQ